VSHLNLAPAAGVRLLHGFKMEGKGVIRDEYCEALGRCFRVRAVGLQSPALMPAFSEKVS